MAQVAKGRRILGERVCSSVEAFSGLIATETYTNQRSDRPVNGVVRSSVRAQPIHRLWLATEIF